MFFDRTIEAILTQPGNDKERAFAAGYRSVKEGTETGYAHPRHVNHRHYLKGVRAAEEEQ